MGIGFALTMVARLLSKEGISAPGVEMSSLELPSWLPAVQRLGSLLYEAVKPASVQLVAPLSVVLVDGG